ncbi:MAG TPA: conjugative transfer signal peptidase TraF [Thermoanaerobaculia bacterium]|nr:conjugative transfer signal peptidase TraF [Thermoanaerobaculia bacterium]
MSSPRRFLAAGLLRHPLHRLRARRPSPRPRPLLGIFSPLAVALALLLSGLRFNTSASLPRGIYLLRRRPPSRVGLVLACPPPWAARLALARHYLPAGSCPGGTQPLGKLLLALPGDRLALSAAGLSVNGRPIPSSLPLPADTAGRPLPPHPYGRFQLGPTQVWLFSTHPRSFDSRYFGPVDRADVLGILQPIWTTKQRSLPGGLRKRRAELGEIPGTEQTGSGSRH